MKNKVTPKKILKNALGYFGAFALSFTAVMGGKSIYTSVKTKNYAPKEQIEEVAKILDCDLSYLNQGKFNNQIRLRHNEDKPIYVSIDSGFNDEEKSDIVYTLDNVFGLMKDINSHYTYEIVDEDKLPKSIFISTIKYKLGVPKNSDTVFANNKFGNKDLFMNPLVKTTTNTSTIIYNRDLVKNQKANRIIILTHELLHSFGFDDVYFDQTGKHYYNTLLEVENSYREYDKSKGFPIITPNDYRCLIAVYAEKFKNEEEKTAYINKFKMKAEEYDSLYYSVYKDVNNLNGFNSNDLHFKGTFVDYIYDVKIKNNSYSFAIYGKNNNIIEKCNGQAINIDGVFFLKNVVLQNGFYSTDKGAYTISDLTIYKDKSFAVIKDLNKHFVVVGNASAIKDKTSMTTFKNNDLCF